MRDCFASDAGSVLADVVLHFINITLAEEPDSRRFEQLRGFCLVTLNPRLSLLKMGTRRQSQLPGSPFTSRVPECHKHIVGHRQQCVPPAQL